MLVSHIVGNDSEYSFSVGAPVRKLEVSVSLACHLISGGHGIRWPGLTFPAQCFTWHFMEIMLG